MGWRRVGTQPPHTSSLPVSLCSSLPLFLLPERHYKNVLSARDAYFKAAITARPPPKRKTESEEGTAKKEWRKREVKKERAREQGRERETKR